MATQLETAGEEVALILLDGSPGYVSQHTKLYQQSRDLDQNEFIALIGAYLRFVTIFRDINLKQVSTVFC